MGALVWGGVGAVALRFGVEWMLAGARSGEAGITAVFSFLLGSISLAVATRALPASLEGLAKLVPGKRFAGAPRAFGPSALSAAFLGFAAWAALQSPHGPTRVGYALASLPLVLGAWLAFLDRPMRIAEWRSVGAIAIRLETKSVRPGGTVRAVIELSRPCRGLTAALFLVDEVNRVARHAGTVSTLAQSGGVWSGSVSADVPLEGPRTSQDGEDCFFWELEISTADDGMGNPVSSRIEVTVS
jgi:hypothetical protein